MLMRQNPKSRAQLGLFIEAARDWYDQGNGKLIDLFGLDNLVIDVNRRALRRQLQRSSIPTCSTWRTTPTRTCATWSRDLAGKIRLSRLGDAVDAAVKTGADHLSVTIGRKQAADVQSMSSISSKWTGSLLSQSSQSGCCHNATPSFRACSAAPSVKRWLVAAISVKLTSGWRWR